jgi:hypothetical protein
MQDFVAVLQVVGVNTDQISPRLWVAVEPFP